MKHKDKFLKLSSKLGLTLLKTWTFILLLSNTAFGQLSGNYTIASGGDFSSTNASVNDLILNGISGPLVQNSTL
ncbi:MAG: hypothetical protein K9H64_06910 [Bacteroidales bacterium]|nr:hypothetical protein [Bacteroidales bacterium]MCF8455511.1 hypothetical protein [Bacteroidales bacterium]